MAENQQQLCIILPFANGIWIIIDSFKQVIVVRIE